MSDTPGAKAPTEFVESGIGDMDVSIVPLGPFLPAYLRIHFRDGAGGTANVYVNEDANQGEEYDVRLITLPNRGLDNDANLIFHSNESSSPSGWHMGRNSGYRITWTDPDPAKATKWGLKLGLATP